MDCRVKPGNDEKNRAQSHPVTRGLDPRVHLLRKNFLRTGWIAGSSPAMTAEALFLLAVLRHTGAVRVDAGGTQRARFRRENLLVPQGGFEPSTYRVGCDLPRMRAIGCDAPNPCGTRVFPNFDLQTVATKSMLARAHAPPWCRVGRV
jgi:hypothetical protein